MENSIYSDKINDYKERNYTTRQSDLNAINKKTVKQIILVFAKSGLLMTMFLMCCEIVHAETQKNYESEIDKISIQIKRISEGLNSDKRILKSEQQQIFDLEKKIKKLGSELSQTRRKIKQQKYKVVVLEEEARKLKQQQQASKQAISGLVLSQYERGKSHHLKTLLNQQSPYAFGRLNNYYSYYFDAYSKKMVKINSQINEYQSVQKQTNLEITELGIQQKRKEQQYQKIEENKLKRKKLVLSLNEKVDKSGSKLKKLKQDKERLNNLLKEIALQVEKLRVERERQKQLEKNHETVNKRKAEQNKKIIKKPSNIVKGGFKLQQGRLSLPVSGKVMQQYNSRIAESGMRSDGLLIETKVEQDVTAIFKGQVVFADWLKGYGLLMIIGHGDNHLSLYGHNKVLYKKAGDDVDSNELIAKTGMTGGLTRPALYFEIRENAAPVDPNLWCR